MSNENFTWGPPVAPRAIVCAACVAPNEITIGRRLAGHVPCPRCKSEPGTRVVQAPAVFGAPVPKTSHRKPRCAGRRREKRTEVAA